MFFSLCILYGSYITILPFSHLYLILFSVQFLSLLCFTLPLCICHPPPPFILGAVKEKHYLFLLADSSGALPTVKQYLLYLFKTYLHMAQHQSQVINQFLLLCISLPSASTFFNVCCQFIICLRAVAMLISLSAVFSKSMVSLYLQEKGSEFII